jgi:hypothetical protein
VTQNSNDETREWRPKLAVVREFMMQGGALAVAVVQIFVREHTELSATVQSGDYAANAIKARVLAVVDAGGGKLPLSELPPAYVLQAGFRRPLIPDGDKLLHMSNGAALGAEAAAAADPVAVVARSACATVLQARHRLVGRARRRGRRRWRR